MGENTVGRRELLRGVGIAAVGGVALSGLATVTPAQASGLHEPDEQLSGSWMIVRTDDVDPTDTARIVLSFADGGVMISHDIDPAGPPLTGTWASRGRHEFRGTIWTGFPGGGQSAPSPTLRVQLRGSARGDTISGTFVTTFFPPEGGDGAVQTGTFSGQRIDA